MPTCPGWVPIRLVSICLGRVHSPSDIQRPLCCNIVVGADRAAEGRVRTEVWCGVALPGLQDEFCWLSIRLASRGEIVRGPRVVRWYVQPRYGIWRLAWRRFGALGCNLQCAMAMLLMFAAAWRASCCAGQCLLRCALQSCLPLRWVGLVCLARHFFAYEGA